MRYSDDYSRKKIKKRPDHQDSLNSKKSQNNRKKQTRLGQGQNTNIQWLYDYDPLKKSIAIVFVALAVAGIIFFSRYEILRPEKKIYDEKSPEVIKTEKIAEELENIVNVNQEVQPVTVKFNKKNQKNHVYVWINKNGNKVYSNKRPIQETNIPYKESNP